MKCYRCTRRGALPPVRHPHGVYVIYQECEPAERAPQRRRAGEGGRKKEKKELAEDWVDRPAAGLCLRFPVFLLLLPYFPPPSSSPTSCSFSCLNSSERAAPSSYAWRRIYRKPPTFRRTSSLVKFVFPSSSVDFDCFSFGSSAPLPKQLLNYSHVFSSSHSRRRPWLWHVGHGRVSSPPPHRWTCSG